MKLNFKFKVSTGQGSSESVGETIEILGVEQIREQMQKKMEGLRCPEHDQVPQLEFSGTGLKDLKINIRACCDTMRVRAAQALK
jgi:hypothetical protein